MNFSASRDHRTGRLVLSRPFVEKSWQTTRVDLIACIFEAQLFVDETPLVINYDIRFMGYENYDS